MSKLQIPNELKYLKGARYEPAMRIYYNDFFLEDILPGFFYLTRTARRRGRGDWAGRTARDVAAELSQRKDKFIGFDDDNSRRILEEWLKASVLRLIERAGTEKVMSVRPLHFMTYRVDLPTNWAHTRSVPEFLAAILHQKPDTAPLGDENIFPLQSPQNLFWQIFGVGLTHPRPHFFLNADLDTYDNSVDLDIEALLAVRVVEGLRKPADRKGEISGFEPLCPKQARLFREDFSLFLRAYAPPVVPVRVLGDYLLCLLALNLTIYSLKHFAASNYLYDTGEWLDDRWHDWEPDIYPDLTGGRVRKSRELARQSFRRHQDWILRQLRTMIGFRLLDYYLMPATDIPELRQLRQLTGIKFLQTLALGRQPSFKEVYNETQGSARPALRGLQQYQQEDGEWPEDMKSIANDPAMPPFDRLVELLAANQYDLQRNILRFFFSITRRNLESGLLSGNPRRQDDNYYTLGIQMLETLVQLLILKPGDPPKLRPLDIYDFVDILKERYGIWIDEPPPSLDTGYEARAAAQANFAALKEKLRQLGFFRAVTDARRMQRLKPRFQPSGSVLKRAKGKENHEQVA
ncbi:MAG: hypothetical protein JRI66_11380 [Deltaproteobacteria bacterium]|nr:hypothetical protein [Deltaproteobacteria bacterium]